MRSFVAALVPVIGILDQSSARGSGMDEYQELVGINIQDPQHSFNSTTRYFPIIKE
jgi:hypothetical protein